MTKRITIGLEPDADQAAIGEALRSSGTEIVRSRVDPGDVMVIDIPADADVKAFLAKVRAVPGVRSAEPDSWQSGF